MPIGTVKFYNPDRGFGFIRPFDGSPDIFFHVTELHESHMDDPVLGAAHRLRDRQEPHSFRQKRSDQKHHGGQSKVRLMHQREEAMLLSDNIFNERGMLRTDLENLTVPPERRDAFDALVAAVRGAEAAEEDVKRKDAAVAEAVRTYDRAVATYPRSTFMDEWRAARGTR